MLLTYKTIHTLKLNNNHWKIHTITGKPTRMELNKAKRINGKLKQESICNNYGVEILLQSCERVCCRQVGGNLRSH